MLGYLDKDMLEQLDIDIWGFMGNLSVFPSHSVSWEKQLKSCMRRGCESYEVLCQ
jgi:hypothetical protein